VNIAYTLSNEHRLVFQGTKVKLTFPSIFSGPRSAKIIALSKSDKEGCGIEFQKSKLCRST
jgi:hypothetical protein